MSRTPAPGRDWLGAHRRRIGPVAAAGAGGAVHGRSRAARGLAGGASALPPLLERVRTRSNGRGRWMDAGGPRGKRPGRWRPRSAGTRAGRRAGENRAGLTSGGRAGRAPRGTRSSFLGRRSRGAGSPARSNWAGDRTTCSRGRTVRWVFRQIPSRVSTTSVQTASDSLRTRICWPPRRESLSTWTSAPSELPGPDDGQAIQRASSEAAIHPPRTPRRMRCHRPAFRKPSRTPEAARRPRSSTPSTRSGTP